MTYLLADIGGTHVRFALANDQGALFDTQTFYGADYKTPEEAILHYLFNKKLKIAAACFAIAAPVFDDEVKMTNLPWIFSKDKIKKILTSDAVFFINDFSAIAYAIPSLTQQDFLVVGHDLQARSLPNIKQKRFVVLGPGTGLGVCGFITDKNGGIVLESEGGHVDFAPQNEFEQGLWHHLHQRFSHVSVERVLSGQGLIDLYQYYCEHFSWPSQAMTAADITAEAKRDLSPSRSALAIFCEILGNVAGNLALTFGATNGVFISGGMVPRFTDFLQKSRFRTCFEAKGRFNAFLKNIPTQVIMDKEVALKGALNFMLH